MKRVPLTGKHGAGRFALVDDADYHRVMAAGAWYGLKDGDGKVYAARKVVNPDSKKKRTLLMHRAILGLEFGDERQGDHRDNDGLNNQRGNLRIATNAQNARNALLSIRNTSGIKGGSLHKASGMWRAYIVVNRRQMELGLFDTIEDAADARRAAAAAFHGGFANHGSGPIEAGDAASAVAPLVKRHKIGAAGVRGVSWKDGKWRAVLCHARKTHALGRFDSIEIAAIAYAYALHYQEPVWEHRHVLRDWAIATSFPV